MAEQVTSPSAAQAVPVRTGQPPALSVRKISKTFGGRRVLSELSLDIAPGEIHALLGENGSGKSTFIKVLSGFHEPDPAGSASIAGQGLDFGAHGASHGLGCRFVHQDLGLIESQSVLDNLAIGNGYPRRFAAIDRRAAIRRAREDLAEIGLDVDVRRTIADLSPAERTGVAVARALHRNAGVLPALLVLDEPTATLPDSDVQRLLGVVRTIAAAGTGVLYVTHRLDEVFSIAHRLTVLRDGKTVTTRPVEGVSRAGLVALLVGDELAELQASSAAQAATAAEPVLEVAGLGTEAVRGVSFVARAGEILGVAGITGSGRETLLGAVFGALPRDQGRVMLGGRLIPPLRPRAAMRAGLAFVPTDRKRHAAILGLSARENLTLADLRSLRHRGQISRRHEVEEVRHWVNRLAVRPSDRYESPLATFSGGNQQKIMFGRSLRLDPRVLLLDEPTQGVDVGAKAQLHRCLFDAAAAGCAIVVSGSDADEIAALCHRVIVLRNGRIAAELSGPSLSVAAVTRESLGTDDEGTHDHEA